MSTNAVTAPKSPSSSSTFVRVGMTSFSLLIPISTIISRIRPASVGLGNGSLVDRRQAGRCMGCLAARCELLGAVEVLIRYMQQAASSISNVSEMACSPNAAVSLTIGAGCGTSSSGLLRFLAWNEYDKITMTDHAQHRIHIRRIRIDHTAIQS